MRGLALVTILLWMCFVAFGQISPGTANAGAAGRAQQSRGTTAGGQHDAQQIPQPTDSGDSRQGGIAQQASSDSFSAPIWMTYRFFFLHLANLEALARQEEAKGNDGEKWRTHDERVAGLSAEEGRTLRQLSHNCNQAVSDMDTRIQAETKTLRNQSSPGQAPETSLTLEVRQAWQQRADTINTCIQELESALGEDSFQKLDTYVRSNFQPIVVPAPGTPASSAKDKVPGGLQ